MGHLPYYWMLLTNYVEIILMFSLFCIIDMRFEAVLERRHRDFLSVEIIHIDFSSSFASLLILPSVKTSLFSLEEREASK